MPTVADQYSGRVVIGPVVTREGGYAFDRWTPENGLACSFCYQRVDDACYARKYEIKSRPAELATLIACATLDEFSAALSSRPMAEGNDFMKQYVAVLDRAAAQVNVFLMVIAIGLGMLDMAVLVGKRMMAGIGENMPAIQAQISGSGDLFASSKPAATRP